MRGGKETHNWLVTVGTNSLPRKRGRERHRGAVCAFRPCVLLKDRRKEYPADTMLLAPKRRYALVRNSFSRASMDTTIRVVLANHHPMIRSNLRLLLERQSAVRVVGEAADGREAVFLTERRHPAVVLLDIQLPLLSGIAAAREISSIKPDPGIIFVTALVDQEYVCEAFKAGARGYVLADLAHMDLVSAIQMVASGGRFLSPAISRKLIEGSMTNSGDSGLSEYERQLCCLLAAGYDQQAIAILLNSTASRVWADYQGVTGTLERTRVPQVVLDSIHGNHHLAGK